MAGNPDQGTLIPLTEDDIKARARMLARMTLELDDLQDKHADEKKAMKAAEDDLARRIKKIAKAVRDGADEPE